MPTFTEMFYADAQLEQGAKLPLPAEHEERAVYVAGGEVEVAGDRFPAGQLLVFRPVAGWSPYALPVLGLWMCGAASHPGGEVHGLCGRNAARAVLRAARLRPWAS